MKHSCSPDYPAVKGIILAAIKRDGVARRENVALYSQTKKLTSDTIRVYRCEYYPSFKALQRSIRGV